jgi:hypothetical protein
MNALVSFAWLGAALAMGFYATTIALAPKADDSGWVMALAFAIASFYCVRRAWREFKAPDASTPQLDAAPSPMPSAADFPGAWRGAPVPLERQIKALKDAGLSLAPGRTIDELLTSWPRAAYESDPYNLLLFMYGSDVEAAPWERAFCERGWNFDMECVVEKGDYVRAFENILRIAGQPDLATSMSDDFRIGADTCEIKYTINGRDRVVSARIDNDWADPEAVTAFVRDIETAIADGRHFWASDNGQASVLFFITDAEATKINALRDGVLERYGV